MRPLVRLLDGQGTVVIRCSEATDGVGRVAWNLTRKSTDVAGTEQSRDRSSGLIHSGTGVGDYVRRIEQAFAAFNERDFDLLVEICHPDVDWTPPVDLPGSRTYHGPDGVREAIDDMIGIFHDLRAEAVRFEQVGDTVVGLYYWRGTAAGSGASIDPFEVKAGFVCQFEDDLARVVRFWTDWESPLEAAGLTG